MSQAMRVGLQDALLSISVIPYWWRYQVLPKLDSDEAVQPMMKAVLTDEKMALQLVQLSVLFPASDLLVIATALIKCAMDGTPVDAELAEAMQLLEEACARMTVEALKTPSRMETVSAGSYAQADGYSEASEPGESFSFGRKKPTNSMN